MSLPVQFYGCTLCNVRGGSAMTWGFRYYEVGQERVDIHLGMGWCHGCNHFAPIEIRPDASDEKRLIAEMDALQIQITEMEQRLPKPRFRFFRRPKPSELLNAEYDLREKQQSLQRLRLLLPLMADRKSGDRCLVCSSEACFHIPKDEFYASFDVFAQLSVRLGCTHPGCGAAIFKVVVA